MGSVWRESAFSAYMEFPNLWALFSYMGDMKAVKDMANVRRGG